MDINTADCFNRIASFLGMRDVTELTQNTLQKKYGFPQADVMVLFGGSILAGGDVLASAMKNHVAEKYIIAGGAGHTTETLRTVVHSVCPDIETAEQPEAEIFSRYLQRTYGLVPDYLETESTNCGNNITFLLELLKKEHIEYSSIILCQDASMQRRMDAVFRRFDTRKINIINFASYKAELTIRDGKPAYTGNIRGMWDIERYITLLLGEIPRLSDTETGYGPKGKGYIAHVDIPENVLAAFAEVQKQYSSYIRQADPLYA